MLSKLNRTIDVADFAAKIAVLNGAGVLFGLDLIYGLPGDNLNGFKESLDYAVSLQPNHLDIFRLTVLPGTVLYEQAGSLNLHAQKDAPYALVSSSTFSVAELEQAESIKTACDIFYNRGGSVGWLFMVLEELELGASDFFSEFTQFIAMPKDPDHLTGDEITTLHLSFVKEQFTKHGKRQYFPVIEDIIKIHGALNKSLYSGPAAPADTIVPDVSDVFKLAPGTVPLSLKYDYNELMNVGELDFQEFLENYDRNDTCLVIYNCKGSVKTLVIDEPLIHMLESLDGVRSFQNVISHESESNRIEMREFFDFAVEEQMLVLCSR